MIAPKTAASRSFMTDAARMDFHGGRSDRCTPVAFPPPFDSSAEAGCANLIRPAEPHPVSTPRSKHQANKAI
jgi:hypothetical protein